MTARRSLLAQLENNEAILLMYLAGELPEQDRLEVQHLLEHDRHLRAELERLQSAIASTDRRLADTENISDANVERTIRRTLLTMHQQQSAPSRRSPEPKPQPAAWRIPAWLYPVAAAAILLITISVYLSNIQPQEQAPIHNDQAAMDLPNAMDLPARFEMDPLATQDAADELIGTLDDTDAILAAAGLDEELADVAAELAELHRLSGQTDTSTELE